MVTGQRFIAGVSAVFFLSLPALAQDFDACEVFTQQDAEAALGTTAQPEPVNPKVKKPKVVPKCTYNGFKEGKPVAATAEFKFSRTEAEIRSAFNEHRLQVQTKPILLPGAEAFWSAKTGQMNVRKERTWLQVTVGPAKTTDRDADSARKAAELLVKKMPF